MSIDLHIHSNHSDGTLSPTEIVERAAARGLQALSLTDHDTVSGLGECVGAGRRLGVEVVTGIELSVEYEAMNMHLLGYFFDYRDPRLQERVALLQQARDERNSAILEKLQQRGINITGEEIQAVSRLGQTGRPHIAQVLKDKGVVKSFDQAFAQYLAKGACAYASRFVYTFKEAVDILKQSGGVTILAHPAQIAISDGELSRLIPKLVSLGLDGLEVYYPSQTSKTRKKLKAIARSHNMVISGGSDYHGQIRPGTNLAGDANFFIPGDLLEKLRQKAENTGANAGF